MTITPPSINNVNKEALKKYWSLNYFHCGTKKVVKGYGIDIIQQFDLKLIPKHEESFIYFLNKELSIGNRGHFQNHMNSDGKMNEEEFLAKFNQIKSKEGF